jgi:hypothetical protein
MNYTLLIYFREQHRHARLIAHVIINNYCFEKDTLSKAAQAQIFHNLSLAYSDRVRAEDRFELLYLVNGIPMQSESWFARRASASELTEAPSALTAAAGYLRLSDAGVVMVREHQSAAATLSLTYICESQFQSEPFSPLMAS